MTTRAGHLQWCKDRAPAYAGRGEVSNAIAPVCPGLRKHPETKDHAGAHLLVMMAMTGKYDRPGELRRETEGPS